MCAILQGDSYLSVKFCKLLQGTKCCRKSKSGKRDVKQTHSFFIDDLKGYQESHKILKAVNETIVQVSHDTGACYGVAKCEEIFLERGKMVKGERLEVLQERMKTVDLHQKKVM